MIKRIRAYIRVIKGVNLLIKHGCLDDDIHMMSESMVMEYKKNRQKLRKELHALLEKGAE